MTELRCSNCRRHKFKSVIQDDEIQILCARCSNDPSWIYRELDTISERELRSMRAKKGWETYRKRLRVVQ
jgi:hypothetical protein